MTRIPLTEAQLRLPELIASLKPGEEVEIFSRLSRLYAMKFLLDIQTFLWFVLNDSALSH